MRDRASPKVIEEDAGIGAPLGHTPPPWKGAQTVVNHALFFFIIFLRLFSYQKMKDKGSWGKRKERVKFTSKFMTENDNFVSLFD